MFEFKVTVHYGLWAKSVQLSPLKGMVALTLVAKLNMIGNYYIFMQNLNTVSPGQLFLANHSKKFTFFFKTVQKRRLNSFGFSLLNSSGIRSSEYQNGRLFS